MRGWSDDTPICAGCDTPFADNDTPPFHAVSDGREYYCDTCQGPHLADAMTQICAALEDMHDYPAETLQGNWA